VLERCNVLTSFTKIQLNQRLKWGNTYRRYGNIVVCRILSLRQWSRPHRVWSEKSNLIGSNQSNALVGQSFKLRILTSLCCLLGGRQESGKKQNTNTNTFPCVLETLKMCKPTEGTRQQRDPPLSRDPGRRTNNRDIWCTKQQLTA